MSGAGLAESPRLTKPSTDPSPKHAINGSTAPRFPDGHVLNERWILKRRIGQGRYSDVYVAISKDGSLEERREVAIKVEKENIPIEGRMLKWEATVLTDIQDCPYVCKMHESGVLDDGGFYIVMDLCSETLSECRKRQPGGQFRPHKGAAAAMSMLNCIEALHRCGYVHRDIKPSNFVRPLKNAKNARRSLLIDFGLARRHHRNGVALPARAVGEFRGTSKYASLNSHSCKELGPRDDIFSFLYVLVDFVLGKLPWVDCSSRNEVAAMKRKFFGRDFVRNDSIPEPIYQIAQHLNTLRFHDGPDYSLIRNAVSELCHKQRPSMQFIPPPPSDSPIKFIPDVIAEPSSPLKPAVLCEPAEASSPIRPEITPYCEACLTQRICEDTTCPLRHPPYQKAFVFSNMIPLPLCIDFIQGGCQKTNCALHHWTETEESQYLSTGSLPSRLLSGSPVPSLLPATLTSPKPIPSSLILPNPQVIVPSPEQLMRWRGSVIKQSMQNGFNGDLVPNFAQATVSCSESGLCEVSAETNTDEGETVCGNATVAALEKAEEQAITDECIDLGDLALADKDGANVQHSVELSRPDEDFHSEGPTEQTEGADQPNPSEGMHSNSAKKQALEVVPATKLDLSNGGQLAGDNVNSNIVQESRHVNASSTLRLPVDPEGTFQSFEEVLMMSEEFKLLMELDSEHQNFEEVFKNAGLLNITHEQSAPPLPEGESSSSTHAGTRHQTETVASHGNSPTRSEQEVVRVEEGADSRLLTPPIRRLSKQLSVDVPRREKLLRYRRRSPGPRSSRLASNSEAPVPNPTELPRSVSDDSGPSPRLRSEITGAHHTESVADAEEPVADAEVTGYCDPRITIRIKRIRREISDVLETVVVLRLKRSLLLLPRSKLIAKTECCDFEPALFDYLKRTMNDTPELAVPDITNVNHSVDREGSTMNELESNAAPNGSPVHSEVHSEADSIDDGLGYLQQLRDPSPIANEVDQPKVHFKRPGKRRSNEQMRKKPGRERSLSRIGMNSDVTCPILGVFDVCSDPIIVKIKRDLISDFITRKRPKIK